MAGRFGPLGAVGEWAAGFVRGFRKGFSRGHAQSRYGGAAGHVPDLVPQVHAGRETPGHVTTAFDDGIEARHYGRGLMVGVDLPGPRAQAMDTGRAALEGYFAGANAANGVLTPTAPLIQSRHKEVWRHWMPVARAHLASALPLAANDRITFRPVVGISLLVIRLEQDPEEDVIAAAEARLRAHAAANGLLVVAPPG